MQVGWLSRENPYAAYAGLVQRGRVGDRAALAQLRNHSLFSLSAPVIKSQYLVRAGQYESLGDKFSRLRALMSELTEPSNVPQWRRPVASPAVPGRAEPAGVALEAELFGGAIALNPGTPEIPATPATAAALTTDPVQLNWSSSTAGTLTGGAIQQSALGGPKGADFGALTINGVTTTLGVYSGNNKRSAAQFIVDRLNANTSNVFTASVGGSGNDQVVLTAKQTGTAGSFRIEAIGTDSDGIASNDTTSGFSVGQTGTGANSSTDLGSVTINGVTTVFGVLANTTVQAAAQFMADRLNADAASTVTAAVGGANNDQLILTSKVTGAASTIAIEAASNSSDGSSANDGSNGFVAGRSAAGTEADPGAPADPGVTDFGSVVLNGIETTFGVIDNRLYTAQTAAQFLADRLNATNSTVRASVQDGRLRVVSREAGDHANIRIGAVNADSDGDADNNGVLGLLAGLAAQGKDAPEAEDPQPEELSEATLDPDQVAAMMGRMKSWVGLANETLEALRSAQEKGLEGVGGYARAITLLMTQETASLASLGIRLDGGRLLLDEEFLASAIQSHPEGTLGSLSQLRNGLDPLLAGQHHAVEFLRGISSATGGAAAQIGEARAILFRAEQRTQQLSALVKSLERLKPDLEEQGDKLTRQQERLGATNEEESAERAESSEPSLSPPHLTALLGALSDGSQTE